MRIPIREQLGLLVLLCSLLSLAIIAITTWVNNYHFVVGIKSQGLELTASLKAAQIAADLTLLETTTGTIVTRILIQQALQRFYLGNTTTNNWVRANADVQSALASGGSSSNLLQVKIFSRNSTGDPNGLLNVTATGISSIELPYTHANGSAVYLGDADLGFPASLYPNLTYVETTEPDPTGDPTTNLTLVYAFPDLQLNTTSALLLGPMQVNSSYSILSVTLPMINNTSAVDILGYMTIIAEATTLSSILTSPEGLDESGVALLLGPAITENRFTGDDQVATATYKPNISRLGDVYVNYIFPPALGADKDDRHPGHEWGAADAAFPLKDYPAALRAFASQNSKTNNASSELSTHNEEGISVAVGYARPQSKLCDWLVIVELSHTEAWAPIVRLRNILLACVFGTAGGIALLVLPLAHFSVRPIRRLRDATEKSVQPPGYSPSGSIRSERLDDDDDDDGSGGDEETAVGSRNSKSDKGILVRLRKLRYGGRRKSKVERNEEARRRVFKIPGRVPDRRHFITDELTELTGTFNEMTDELMMQYARLEDRVAERTRELEISKKAAEAANESKTLFIANISHELKTPLNGILGMCAVCMGEEDLPRIKRSLQVVYKSGDLLLHLLNDLLTFSKNQIGQSLSLEEKEFRLSDVKSQIVTIFDKQVREGHINFGVFFLGSDDGPFTPDGPNQKMLPALGPHGTGRLKDMCLWGDQHRILQVIINLVSNSLKFTPEGGKVEVRIRCIGEAEPSSDGSRKDSLGSKGSYRQSRNRHRGGSGSGSNASASSRIPSLNKDGRSSTTSMKVTGTALSINPMDPKATPHVQVRERSPTPPPAHAKTLIFEFEVEDTGPGIPEAMQQRVFEPFVQGDLGLSKKYGGTGLGLSICSQLATLMGGTITLESTVGKGTTL
jgi:osomolarity two-component system sensor histidine kinase SLN1